MMSWFPTWEYESSRLIPKILLQIKFFSDSDETEEESEEDDDIDYDQNLITRKSKVITCENNSSTVFNVV